MNDQFPPTATGAPPPPTAPPSALRTSAIDPALEANALAKVQEILKGNGVKPEQIKIEKFDGHTYEFFTYNTLLLKTKLLKKRQAGKVTGLTVVASAQDMQFAAERELTSIRNSTESTARLKDMIFARKDMGIGLKNELVKTDFLNKEYVYYEPCAPCQGRGRIICPRCHGKGSEGCPRCYAAGLESCPTCGGRQYVLGPNNQNVQCLRCNGGGKIPCTMCHQSKKVQCPSCKGRMHLTCQQCNGHAAVSVIGMNEINVEVNYSYDKTGLPPAAAKRIDVLGAKIREHATISPAPTQNEQRSEIILMAYNVQIPLADISVIIEREKQPPLQFDVALFGTQAVLMNAPPFLETLIAPGVRYLEAATAKGANVKMLLHKAARYKTLRLIILAASKFPPKKALAAVMQKTEIGLSEQQAEKLIAMAHKALSHISLMPRIMGSAGGAVIMLCVCYLYFSDLRVQIVHAIPNAVMLNMLDIIVALGSFSLIYFGGQIMAAHAKKTGLSALQPKKK